MTPWSLPDIQAVLNIAPHVKAVSLDVLKQYLYM